MLTALKPLRLSAFALTLALSLAALGCHAQSPALNGSPAAGALSPDETRRVAVLIRSRSNIPAEYEIQVGPRMKSDVPGFDQIIVSFSAQGRSKPVEFLLSTDGKTLAQFNKYDISKDPKTLVSAAGRPPRGGPANAPVVIVGFDDLECPYCARMHAQLFPALLDRYKDQVRVVYLDFPLDQHPWAMRAAVDVNCVGAQSTTGYWNLVDYIHAHGGDIGGQGQPVAKANDELDTLSREEGKRQKVSLDTLNACIAKQDDSAIRASMKQGEELGVGATPALFINGEKVEGAERLEYVYRMIDNALIAAGQTPPPPVKTQPEPPPQAEKPGN